MTAFQHFENYSTLPNVTETEVTDYFSDFHIVYHCVRLVQTIIGIIGNTMVIVIITKTKTMHTPANYILISLAGSDLVSSTFAPLLLILDQLKVNGVPSVWIPLCHFSLILAKYGSIVNLSSVALSAVDRFISIKYAIIYRLKMTNNKMIIIIVALWLAILVKGIIEHIAGASVRFDLRCLMEDVMDPTQFKIGTVYSFVIPSIITTSLYVYVVSVARKRFSKSAGRDKGDNKYQRTQKRMTRVMFTVFAAYYICYVPLLLGIMIPNHVAWKPLASDWLYMLYFFNSMVNPPIYYWKNVDFKKAFLKLLGSKNQVDVSTTGASSTLF